MTVELRQLRVEAVMDASKYVEGMRQKASADAAAVDSGNKLSASLTQTQQKLGTAGTAVERLAKQIDPAYLSQTRLEAGTRLLQRALDNGSISAERHGTLLGQLTAKYGAGVIAAGAAGLAVNTLTAAHDRASQAGTQFRTTLRLAHELMAGDYRVALGNAAVEMQEFGKASLIARAAMNPFVAVGIVVVGTFVAMAYEANRSEAQLRAFDVTLKGMGASSITTAANLQVGLRQLRDVGLSSAEAQAAIQGVIRAGLNPAMAGDIARTGLNIGAITGDQNALTAALKGGPEGIIALGLSIHQLSAEEVDNMRTMARHGDGIKALDLGYKLLKERTNTALEESKSGWKLYVEAVEANISGLLDKLGEIGTAAEKAAKAGLAAAMPPGSTAGRYGYQQPYVGPPPPGVQVIGPDGLPTGYASNFSISQGVSMSGQAPAFADMLSHAAEQLPAGYSIVLTSADRPGGSASPVGMGSAHVGGHAADFQIIGPNGERYPNTGADTTGLYGKTFAAAQSYAQWAYPGMAPYLRTGATFGANGGPISPSSPADIGHLDTRGGISPADQSVTRTDAVNTMTAAIDKQVEARARDVEQTRLKGTAADALRAKDEAQAFNIANNISGAQAERNVQDAVATVYAKKAIELEKLNEIQKQQTAGVLASAAAYRIDEVAGLRATAMAEAQLKALQENRNRILGYSATDVNVAKETQRILEQNAATAIDAGAKQVAAAVPVVAANQRMAEAAKLGTAAETEAQIANQAAAQTHNALTAALASGNEALIARARDLTTVAEAQIRANDAAKQSVEIGHAVDQQKNQIAVSGLEIGLQGQPSDEIARQVANLKAAQDIQGKLSLAAQDQKDAYLASTDALGAMNVKLADAQRNQQRLDEGVRSIADTVDNTLVKSIDDAFSGAKVESWGTRLRTMLGQLASQIANAFLIKPLTGTVLSSLGLGSASQSFGSFGSLFGGSSSSSSGTTLQATKNSDGTWTFKDAASSANSVTGLFGKTSNFFNDIFGSSTSTFSSGSATTSLSSGLSDLTGGAPSMSSGISDLLGGIPTAASSASSIFGGASSFLSSVVPFAGLALGAGSLLGSLFGLGGSSKPRNNFSQSTISLDTGVISDRTGHGGTNASTVSGIVRDLSSFVKDLKKAVPGATIGGGGTMEVGAGTNTGIEVHDAFGVQRFATAADAVDAIELEMAQRLEGVSATMKTVLAQTTDAKDISANIKFAQSYDDLKKASDSAFSSIASDTKKAGPFKTAFDNIKTIFDDLTTSADEFGLSLDPINKGLAEANKRLRDDFAVTIKDLQTGLTDSGQLLVDQEKALGKTRLQEAKDIGADLVAVNKLNADSLDKIWKDQTKTLTDLQTSLKSGSLSGESAADQAKAALDTYNADLTKAKGGNLSAIADVATSGSNVVSLYQSTYGNSSKTNKLRTDVLAAIDDVLATRSFASGTDYTPPGWIRVGESGPEWINQGGGATVLPAGSAPSSFGGSDFGKKLDRMIALMGAHTQAVLAVGNDTGRRLDGVRAGVTKTPLTEPQRRAA